MQQVAVQDTHFLYRLQATNSTNIDLQGDFLDIDLIMAWYMCAID